MIVARMAQLAPSIHAKSAAGRIRPAGISQTEMAKLFNVTRDPVIHARIVLDRGTPIPADHVSVSLARITNRIESGRPAIAPPKPSVIETGKHLLKATSILSANLCCSETSPGNLAKVIFGFPSRAPSRRRLKTIVSSDPTCPLGVTKQLFNSAKSSLKVFAGEFDAVADDGAIASAQATAARTQKTERPPLRHDRMIVTLFRLSEPHARPVAVTVTAPPGRLRGGRPENRGARERRR